MCNGGWLTSGLVDVIGYYVLQKRVLLKYGQRKVSDVVVRSNLRARDQLIR